MESNEPSLKRNVSVSETSTTIDECVHYQARPIRNGPPSPHQRVLQVLKRFLQQMDKRGREDNTRAEMFPYEEHDPGDANAL